MTRPRPFPQRANAGPVTRRAAGRCLLVYAGFCGAGFTMAELASSSWAKALGLGLMLPGAVLIAAIAAVAIGLSVFPEHLF